MEEKKSMIWSEILNQVFIISIIAGAIRIGTPLIMGAIGETFVERSGVMNLGIEGLMLIGALSGFAGAYATGNVWIGVLAAIIIGGLGALLMAFLSVTLTAQQAIAGIAIWMLFDGMAVFANKVSYGRMVQLPTITGFSPLNIPYLSQLPIIGQILFSHNIMVYVGILIVVFSNIILFKTAIGLKIRSVGENPLAADSLGINVSQIRFLCVVIGGMLAGLGGAYITLSELHLFSNYVISGRGWIAFTIVYFGRWKPYGVLIAGLFFGFVEALQLRLQSVLGTAVPYQLLLMLPYVLTILVLTLSSGKQVAPEALARPYRRGEK